MSELTPCNYCTMQAIIRRHPHSEIKLVTDDWTVMFVDGERVASFLELPKECVC